MFTRFDDMPYPYAAIVWDMVLPLQTLDENAILAFYTAYAEQFNPERQCAYPSPTPGAATPSPAPSGSPTAAPSGAATPGASAAPSPAGS